MVVYASIILFLVVLSGIGTILIGNSRSNKEGNPDYEKRTSSNIVRLTVFYVIATVIGVAILIYMIV